MSLNLDPLVPRSEGEDRSDRHCWATVTNDDPLEIKLDGETEPLPLAPDALVSGLEPSDRVLVALTANNDPTFRARRVVVLGRSGGMQLPSPIPTGVVWGYIGSVAPDGWLLCDGSPVSRTTYAALFAVIGTTYGSGDGSTTFNLPNLKGRVPVGHDASQTEFDTLGKTGGAKTHTLTVNEMPSHTHIQDSHNHTQNSHSHTGSTASAGNHTHNVRYRSGGTLGPNDINDAAARMFGGSLDASSFSTLSGGAHTHSVTINSATATNNSATATNQNTGGDQPHNNLQPYVVINYIIKF